MIELQAVTRTFLHQGRIITALPELSLSVLAGERVAITGPSGSGKSTLLNIIGLLDGASRGVYHLGGENTSAWSDARRSSTRQSHFGFVFQSFRLVGRLTVLENVLLAATLGQRRAKPSEIARARDQLQAVGLSERLDYTPAELSGGELQRVAFARALLNDPPVILADEPTGNLDAVNRDSILALLGEQNSRGKTVIVVTHDPIVAEWAERTVSLSSSRRATPVNTLRATR